MTNPENGGKLRFIAETTTFLVALIVNIAIALKNLVIPRSQKSVENEVVLVTGAGSGIGRLTAYRFAGLKCKMVICWDINESENQKTATTISESLGTKSAAFKIDLSNREEIYRVAQLTKDLVKKELGSRGIVTILVNNAGIVTGKDYLSSPDIMIQKTMQVNTTSHFWTCKQFLPDMLERNEGHICGIASSAGHFPANGLADYCSSKFALIGFYESLYIELRQKRSDVQLTVICPYIISTGMFEGAQTRFPWLLPILTPNEMTDRIMLAIRRCEFMVLYPKLLNIFRIVKPILPINALYLILDFMGGTTMMSNYTGRVKKE